MNNNTRTLGNYLRVIDGADSDIRTSILEIAARDDRLTMREHELLAFDVSRRARRERALAIHEGRE